MTQRLEQKYIFGDLLREWRGIRNMTQMALAHRAQVSPRHLSFVENGRSVPSRSLVIRLAEHLQLPLRERNQLLLASGFAPEYTEHEVGGAQLSRVRTAIRKLLDGHNPYPALVVDRGWNLIEANASVGLMLTGVAPELLAEPCNVLRMSLHPKGLAPSIRNLLEWREHVLDRLRRQMLLTGDRQLRQLHDELETYGPAPARRSGVADEGRGDVVVSLQLQRGEQVLSLFSTVTTFGTPRDITVEELAIEAFYPADDETASFLQRQ